jgi:hypothetical protein
MRPTPAPTATPYEDPDQPAAQDERDAAITTLVGLIQRNAKSSEKA